MIMYPLLTETLQPLENRSRNLNSEKGMSSAKSSAMATMILGQFTKVLSYQNDPLLKLSASRIPSHAVTLTAPRTSQNLDDKNLTVKSQCGNRPAEPKQMTY